MFFCAVLTGCTGIDGKAPDQNTVLKRVDLVCSEPYELISVVQTGERPESFVYTFVTERGLTFTAQSYLQRVYLDASATNFYTPTVSVFYVDAVHEQYGERVSAILSECPQKQQYGFAFLSFGDAEEAARYLAEADAVYAEELAWNDEQFLKEYPLSVVNVRWYRDASALEENRDACFLCSVGLNGTWTQQTLQEYLEEQYAQAYVDGEIENGEDIPRELVESLHVSELTTLTLDGQVMTYDTLRNQASAVRLSTEDYAFSWYSGKRESYMLVCDVGFVSESQSYPLIAAEYVAALGGEYHVNTKGFDAYWTIDGVTWQMTAQYEDGAVRGVEVTRDGVPLKLDYVTVEDDWKIGATFCIGLPVDQFAKLFDLSYEIDEESRWLAFFS